MAIIGGFSGRSNQRPGFYDGLIQNDIANAKRLNILEAEAARTGQPLPPQEGGDGPSMKNLPPLKPFRSKPLVPPKAAAEPAPRPAAEPRARPRGKRQAQPVA